MGVTHVFTVIVTMQCYVKIEKPFQQKFTSYLSVTTVSMVKMDSANDLYNKF